MSHPNRKILASSVLAVTAAVTAAVSLPALAQEAPPPRAEATVRPAPAPPQAAARPAAAAEPPLTMMSLMQENDGSMLQATLIQQAAAAPPAAAAGGATVARASATNLYAVPTPEPRVLKKHDIVKIVVRQESKSQTNGLSDQERQVDFDAKVDAYLKFNLQRISLDPADTTNTPEVKAEGQRDFKGTGEFDRSDTFTDRVAAEVIDVKPNGTMVLQARSHMQVDDEKIDVALSGTCRVQDVQADDTVLSTDMADLRLSKETTGEVHDTTKRGAIHALLDLLNPF